MNFFNELLGQFSEAENLAGMVAEHLLGILIILTPIVVTLVVRRRLLARGQIRGSLSCDLFLPIRRQDGSTVFANRTILMANLRDLLPDEGVVSHLFGVFREMERAERAKTEFEGRRYHIGIVRLERPGVYWGVAAMLVKHLSALHGETFLELAARGKAAGADEGAETDFVMALVYAKAARNWFPRLLVVQKDFLLSLPERCEDDFCYALAPHTRDLPTLQALARLYMACEGDQGRLAAAGLVVATVSLPTEEG